MRCVNLDWLEVYCLESMCCSRDAAYFQAKGIEVKARAYGTPQYREVFTLYDKFHMPFIEVRRNPYSIKSQGGIFEPRACHIRLANRALYQPNPVGDLRRFLLENDYEFKSLSRVDICCDFNSFDDGTKPEKFIDKLMKETFWKINQSRIHPHGVEYAYKGNKKVDGMQIAAHAADKLRERIFNSIKWGHPSSCITTKIYDKTLELQQNKPKKYIQSLWRLFGLQNDESTHVWRVEFSLNSQIKNFVRLDSGELIYMSLTTIDNREKCTALFLALAQQYFHFKKRVLTRNGTVQRKDRCPDYFPFSTKDVEVFKVVRLPVTTDPTRLDRQLMRRLKEIYNERKNVMNKSERNGALDFLSLLANEFAEEWLDKFADNERDTNFLYNPD